MADHQEFLDLANELIEEEGRRIDLLRFDTAPADPSKPWKTTPGTQGPTVVKAGVYAVFVPKSGSEFGELVEDKEMFKDATHVCLVGGLDGSTDYETINAIQDEGQQWKVDAVQKLRPANLTILYLFGVSR